MEKNNKIITAILLIIIIGLASYIVYDKGLKNNQDENNNIIECEKVKAHSEVVGKYEYIIEAESEETPSTRYQINIYNNGIFHYQTAKGAPMGILGNYVIDDNKIVLNYLLRTSSDVSLYPINGSNTLTINDDNSLTGSVKEFVATDNKITVTLKKISNIPDEIDLKNWMSSSLCGDQEYCKNAESPM